MAPSASATASMSSAVPIEIRRHWDSSAAPDTSRTRMPCSSKSRWKTVRGRAFFVLGSAAEAVLELEEALKAKDMEEAKTATARDALYFCGCAHLRTGEMLKAIRRLEQVARVAPEHRRVREALDRVYEEDRRRLERPLSFTQDLETLAKGTPRA